MRSYILEFTFSMNRARIIAAMAILLCVTGVSAGTIKLSGTYQGKNIYVQNPFTGNLKDFCTDEVYVNDKLILKSPKSSAFEIDLSYLNLKDAVTIKIIHKDDCLPKILNPQVIQTKSKFAFSSFNIDEDGIHWSTKGERSAGTFYVQQFVNNSWSTIKKVSGRGKPSDSYNINSEHHSGKNTYRVRYLEEDGQTFYSKEVDFASSKIPVKFYPKRVTDFIYFEPAEPVKYVIYDRYANVVKKGKAAKIDCTDLKGHEQYTIVFDNQTKDFLKKEVHSH